MSVISVWWRQWEADLLPVIADRQSSMTSLSLTLTTLEVIKARRVVSVQWSVSSHPRFTPTAANSLCFISVNYCTNERARKLKLQLRRLVCAWRWRVQVLILSRGHKAKTTTVQLLWWIESFKLSCRRETARCTLSVIQKCHYAQRTTKNCPVVAL